MPGAIRLPVATGRLGLVVRAEGLLELLYEYKLHLQYDKPLLQLAVRDFVMVRAEGLLVIRGHVLQRMREQQRRPELYLEHGVCRTAGQELLGAPGAGQLHGSRRLLLGCMPREELLGLHHQHLLRGQWVQMERGVLLPVLLLGLQLYKRDCLRQQLPEPEMWLEFPVLQREGVLELPEQRQLLRRYKVQLADADRRLVPGERVLELGWGGPAGVRGQRHGIRTELRVGPRGLVL